MARTLFLRHAVPRVVLAWSLACPMTPAHAAPEAQREVEPSSPSQPPADPEVLRLYEAAHRHFRAQEYDRASDELQRAYARTGAPALLFDLGQAARLAGHCGRAVTYYARFLDTDPAPGPRGRTEALLRALGSCGAAEGDPAASAGATRSHPATAIAVPPAVPAAPPPPAPRQPPSLLVAAGGSAIETSEGHRRASNHRRGALIWAMAAAGLFATSGYFGFRAISSAEQVSSAFKPGTTWAPASSDAERTGATSERVAIGTAIAGGLAASAALWLLLEPSEK